MADRITDLLLQLRDGNSAAMDQLFPLVYEELKRLAHRRLLGERPEHTLSTTDLVHESYFRLVDQSRVEWQDRGHFFRIASLSMRRVLVDYARRHLALRRGGGLEAVSLEEDAAVADKSDSVVGLDEALSRLAKFSERLSQVVECRFFGGLSEQETAEALGMTLRTVQRDWAKARGWLYLELRR
jgi:RNA polymerase sigma factor (TIGR02999 family)